MKGLLFSEPMVRAWMEGRKTVTRRLMNPQPSLPGDYTEDGQGHRNYAKNAAFSYSQKSPLAGWYFGIPGMSSGPYNPPYLPGETVYVRETWRCDNPAAAQDVYSSGIGLFYKAGISEEELAMMPTNSWKSPRFMPEWASRSHALIVSVRPEHIRDITITEVRDEGIAQHGGYAITSFYELWEFIYPGSWVRNDWVWRIELEKKP